MKQSEIRGLVKTLAISIVSAVLVSVAFWGPVVENLSFYEQGYRAFTTSFGTDSQLTIFNVIRGLGSWPLYSNYNNIPYLAYASKYLNDPLAMSLTLLFPVLAFGSILVNRGRRYPIVLGAISVMLIFVLKAVQPPGGELFVWIVQNVPLAKAFADPYDYLEPVLGLTFALLIGFTFEAIQKRISLSAPRRSFKPIMTYAVLFLTLAALIYSSWPLANGQVNTGLYNANGVTFPAYYSEAASWINTQQGDFRVLVLPLTSGQYPQFSWSYIGNFYPQLISKPIVMGYGYDYQVTPDPLLTQANDTLLTSNSSESIGSILAIMGVKYILYDAILISASSTNVFQKLEADSSLSLVWSEGAIHIFENNKFQSTIYVPQSVQILPTGSEYLPGTQLLANSSLDAYVGVNDFNPYSGNLTNHASVNIIGYNPTEFSLVLNSTGPVLLVFSESFSSGWSLSSNGLTDTYHIHCNIIENCWLILGSGIRQIQVSYAPQTNFIVYSVVSLSSLFVLLCIAYKNPRKSDSRRKEHGNIDTSTHLELRHRFTVSDTNVNRLWLQRGNSRFVQLKRVFARSF